MCANANSTADILIVRGGLEGLAIAWSLWTSSRGPNPVRSAKPWASSDDSTTSKCSAPG